jgi:hypothetical protein
MRLAASLLLGSIALAAASVSASATPLAPLAPAPQAATIVPAAAGCGWGFHRNRWGHCVPGRRPYYRPYRYGYWRGYSYWPGYYGPGYYADGYEPWNRPSPSDRVANQLNRQERAGMYYGY